ncbi:MAG TPA: circularly permuted type 2 ATP-grasp protein, partial [Tepidisphaeraceae bacterium]|nr:circularly permuted type 2 ATP-grasp protein [Tepidisphaeraceae bacterium]
YFEHSYLAKYLGYTLVQGNDLTVRDGFCYLKTLSGLQRVDVILRRVDDDFCDPLELYHHSFLGVTGLVEAVRQGNVAVANALGSGLAQAPAFLSFLPELCRKLLGEELKLPSVQTWWCGEASSRKFVLENLSRLVIKPAFPTAGSDPQFGEAMSQEERSALAERIAAHPQQYVGQEAALSRTAPVLLEDRVDSRHFVIRAYATAERDSYSVMSGGLTRVTGLQDARVVSLQRGGGSKDTWILAEGPVNEVTLLSTASQPVELTRGGGELTSRVADDLFWLGRYVQRFEADVRVARCMFSRLMDQARLDLLPASNLLAAALFGMKLPPIEETRLSELTKRVFDGADSGGLRTASGHVRNLVRGLRDRVSADAWRVLLGIERQLADFNTNLEDDQIGQVVELFNNLIVDLMAFGGVVAESMTRGQGWRFLDMGSRIERAVAVARLLRATLGRTVPAESAVLDALLEVADSSLTYRRRYLTQLQTHAVVDLLVADETNPRAVLFQIAALQDHLSHLPRETTHPHRNPDRQAVMKIHTQLSLVDLRSICQPNNRGARAGLVSLMNNLISSTEKISEWISRIYFNHAAVSRSLQGGAEDRSR